jgi:FkbM family methyltransferase
MMRPHTVDRFLHYRKTVGAHAALLAIAAKLRGTKVLHAVERRELEHPLWLRIPSSDVDAYGQIFVDADYDFVADPPPRTIVDAGANIGLAAVYFANRYPRSTTIALEPEPGNFRMLAQNAAPYPNIVPVQAALWNRNEAIELFDPGLGDWSFMTGAGTGSVPGKACGTVRAMTLDTLIDEYGLDRIDVLKMDIEGAESEVFEDASSWIDRVDALIIELHERMKPGCTCRVRAATAGFDSEWERGENLYFARGGRIARRPA